MYYEETENKPYLLGPGSLQVLDVNKKTVSIRMWASSSGKFGAPEKYEQQFEPSAKERSSFKYTMTKNIWLIVGVQQNKRLKLWSWDYMIYIEFLAAE